MNYVKLNFFQLVYHFYIYKYKNIIYSVYIIYKPESYFYFFIFFYIIRTTTRRGRWESDRDWNIMKNSARAERFHQIYLDELIKIFYFNLNFKLFQLSMRNEKNGMEMLGSRCGSISFSQITECT